MLFINSDAIFWYRLFMVTLLSYCLFMFTLWMQSFDKMLFIFTNFAHFFKNNSEVKLTFSHSKLPKRTLFWIKKVCAKSDFRAAKTIYSQLSLSIFFFSISRARNNRIPYIYFPLSRASNLPITKSKLLR